jgi:ABC-type uncharacterized transport system auxiliary subunit
VGAAAALVVLWLGGCAQAPVPEDQYFRLHARTPPALAAPRLPGTLVVKRFAADALLSQRALVYVRSDAPQALYQYHYHLWAETPTAMLQQVFAGALRDAQVADQVVTPSLGVDAEHALAGRIVRLEHLVGEPASVAVELELAVFDDRRHELVMMRTYSLQLDVPGPDVEAAVAAMNDALTRIVARFVSDLGAS